MLEDDAVFEPGRSVILSGMGRDARETEIELFRRQHGRCIVKFRGIDSIAAAQQYVGSEIRIPADTLPALKEGWFYTFELKGCEVFTTDGEFIGTITDVLSGGTEILKVDRGNAETLIPFAQSYVKGIDRAQRRVEVELPADLRNLNK